MNQSNSILANRIAELERQLSSTKNLLESSMLSEATAKQYAEEIDKQNQELAAHVMALRDTCNYWIQRGKPEGNCTKQEFNTWLALGLHSDAMKKPSQQHLAEIRAQAGRAGFIYASQYDFNRIENDKINTMADKYADRIRQEGE